MNCDWTEIPGTKDERGWRRVQCQRRRCKWTSLPQAPPPDDTIHVDCTGFPHDHELTEWIAFFSRAFQLTEQQAICEFIRWRAEGADLSELDAFRGVPSPPPEPPLNHGPGTELKNLLAQLKISPTSNCDCEAVAQEMDRLGVKGVEMERERFLTHMREKYAELNPSWADKAAIGTRALAMGLVINPLDPGSSLLNEAIKRAKFLTRKQA